MEELGSTPAKHGKRVGTEIDKNGTIVDERNSTMSLEYLKEWNEKNEEENGNFYNEQNRKQP